MSERTELELIADSRAGDQEALAELFRRHYALSVAVARGILTQHDEALDAVQSAYLSAFRNLDSFRGESSFKTWITRIVTNQCLMRLRERARRHFVELDGDGLDAIRLPIADRAPTPEDLAMRKELRSALVDAAARLPKKLQEVFLRYTLSGFSIEETARALGLTVPAAKTRLFRARTRIRSRLQSVWMRGHAPRHVAIAEAA